MTNASIFKVGIARGRTAAVMAGLLIGFTCEAGSIYQKWDNGNDWITVNGSGAIPACTITPLPSGKHYLYTSLGKNTNNNGRAACYTPLGTMAIPAGTAAGAVTPFWMQFDFRTTGGSSHHTIVGVFNAAGDNDNSPALNYAGALLEDDDVIATARNSSGNLQSSQIAHDGINHLYRVLISVFNSGGRTLMDLTLKSINETTFSTTTIGTIDDFVLLDTGMTFQQGLDSFGVCNSRGSDGTTVQIEFDNLYFSTDYSSRYENVPSFAALCVSAVLQSGSSYFDPWNESRWAAWYTDGEIDRPFVIDCDVTLATRSGAWKPDVSGMTTDYMFLMNSCSRGITFDGNGQEIDTRLAAPSIGTLYAFHDLYPDSVLFPLQYLFLCQMSKKSGVGETTIRNLWVKGCLQAIRTSSAQAHALRIEDTEFRMNKVGVYLSGQNTTVESCGIKQSARSGMYLGSGSHNNYILDNNWRDNNYEQRAYYSDISVDSSYLNVLEGNTHQSPEGGDYHVAVKLYRNMGEDGNLRENPPWGNRFADNSVEDYSVGFEVGSRMGEDVDYDMSDEARDYAPYNLFESNSFTNTTVGIKINASGNELNGNTFSSVSRPIVLHCPFFSLTETAINNQPGTKVSFWFLNSDWNDDDDFAEWFQYQNDRNDGISSSSKYIHLCYGGGTPSFDSYSGSAKLVKQPAATNPSQIIDLTTMKDVFKAGGTPIDIAVGDFWEDSPGDEIAVIWNSAVSMVDGTSYYSIIIYDSDGIEVNRCGKSTVKWRAIAAGNFTDLKGQEIAAVHESAVSGKYPIYVFARGRKTPSATLLPSNTTKINALTAGNFNTGTDAYDEVAYVKSSATNTIYYCKPTLTNWTASTTGVQSVFDLAGGDFDSAAGDEVAVITSSSTQAYLYKVGGTTHYNTAGPGSGSKFTAIAAGDFDGDATDEVALALYTATGGEYPIRCYKQGSTTHFKELSQNVLGVRAKAIAAVGVPVDTTLGVYERAQGFTSSDYGETMASWGDCVAVAPVSAQTNAIPVFLLNACPTNSAQEYLKVSPIVR